MNHLIKKDRKINKKHFSLNVKRYVLIGVIAILAVSSIFMTVETATSGVEVSDLLVKERELASQKRNLEGTLVTTLSVNGLEGKSTEMGYVKPTVLVYVSESQPVAKLP